MSFESSLNLDKDYFTVTLNIALEIFNEYLKNMALNKVDIPISMKKKIYSKFGICDIILEDEE